MRWQVVAIGTLAGLALGILVGNLTGRSDGEPRLDTSLADASAVVLHDVVVRGEARADLFVPALVSRREVGDGGDAGASTRVRPFVVYLHEKGWPAPDDRERSGVAVADALGREGIAVAVVSFALAADTKPVTDVVNELVRIAPSRRLDPAIVLMGDEHGAAVAARLALSGAIGTRGVITLNAIFDGIEARADAPPFLILTAHDESQRSPPSSRRFARALERAGAKEVHAHHVGLRDVKTLGNLSGEQNEVGELVVSFVRGERVPPGGPESTWAIDDRWGRDAPYTSEPFSREPAVKTEPITPALRAQMLRIYGDAMHELEPWPGKTYASVPLADFLKAHPELASQETGPHDFVEVRNVRNELLVLRRDETERRKPEIVVGIDDETNLFRLVVTYSVLRSYSWRPETEPRPLLARPVGAFLHFPDVAGDVPAGSTRVSTLADFALTTKSFRVVATDPLGAARKSPPMLLAALTNDQGCLQCHALGGEGPRSHHLRASDGAKTGGDALPLEEYPHDVLRRFLFEQGSVAKMFGVNPLKVSEGTATAIFAAATGTTP